ncbi:6758_t:CDS:2, partial [Entrophospora sp. SA101]
MKLYVQATTNTSSIPRPNQRFNHTNITNPNHSNASTTIDNDVARSSVIATKTTIDTANTKTNNNIMTANSSSFA